MVDKDHIGYTHRFGWECSCGKSSSHFTTKSRAKGEMEHHEEYGWHSNEHNTELVESI
jgi:hypothetical protein